MPMQILHPFAGSVQQYLDQLGDADRYRPDHCPQCPSQQSLTSLGFYTRTIIDATYELPISTPVINTSTPPSPTCSAAVTQGVSM